MHVLVCVYIQYVYMPARAVTEEQRNVAQKEASELRASLREVDKARMEARREVQELRRQLKMLELDRAKLLREIEELTARIAKDEERDEAVRSFTCSFAPHYYSM